MKSIFLVGYMSVGKSTIGKKLAEIIGYRFVDIDIYIENRFRERIVDMLPRMGEEAFRLRERYILEELVGIEDCVISTGGGLPCFHNNMELLKSSGVVVFLEGSLEKIASRLELTKRTRPLLKDKDGDELLQTIGQMLRERTPYYEEAHLRYSIEEVQTSEDELSLANQIALDLMREEIV